MKTVMLFFQFFIYPILHSDCCYLTEPKCGLWTRFPGYITSLPLCPQPPSQHLATVCAFWTASGAAGARFRPSPEGRLLPSTESRWLQVPETGHLACYRPVLQQLFLSREEGRWNTPFSCNKFTEIVWYLEVSLCHIQRREADLALPAKLFHAAKSGNRCKALPPMAGVGGRMA